MVSVQYHPRHQIEMGKGQWYLNIYHLKKSSFRNPIARIINDLAPVITENWAFNAEDDTFVDQSSDVAQLALVKFKHMIAEIRSFAITTQKAIAKVNNITQKKLERKIAKIESKLPRTRIGARRLKTLQARLKAFMTIKSRNQTLMSHAKWILYGRPTSADF